MPRRLKIVVLAASALLGAGLAPPPALANIVISPTVVSGVQLNKDTCATRVVIMTFANFSEIVRVDGVQISFNNGGPLGKADSHTLGGGATSDQFIFTFDTGVDIQPGQYVVTAAWEAHNGNGLSRATAKTQGTVVPPFPSAAKAGKEAKCGLDETARDYRHAALNFSAAAHKLRPSCLECAYGLENTAILAAELAMLAENLANDPPDPNYTMLPEAVVPTVRSVVVGPGISADAATALNNLLHTLGVAVGQARAALTAVERAQGAREAHDATWEERQSIAAAGFFTGLATQLDALPAAMDAAGAAMRTGGFPNPTPTLAEIQGVMAELMASTKPERLTDDEFVSLKLGTGVGANDFTEPVPVLDSFAKANFDNATTVAALRADAATLTADPLIDRSGEAAPTPSPSPEPSEEPSPSLVPTVAEQPSLLNNSGFEAPSLQGSAFATLTAGKQPALDGWQLKGSVDVVAAGGGLAATGGQFLDLSGNDTGAGPGTITQKVKVIAGHTYRLSFQLSGNPNGQPAVKTIEVRLGGKRQTFTFDTTGHTNTDLGWTTQTMQIQAPCGSSTMTVSFASKTEGARGPNLDNVVLADLGGAECSASYFTWWIALGAVLLVGAAVGYLLIRRRRARSAAKPDAAQANPVPDAHDAAPASAPPQAEAEPPTADAPPTEELSPGPSPANEPDGGPDDPPTAETA